MDFLPLQIIFSVSVFVVMFSCMILPACCFSKSSPYRNPARERTLSCCNCIATGVFIGMCFLGLIPDVHQRFENLGSKLSFPIAEFVVVFGFFVVLFIEQFLTSILAKTDNKRSTNGDAMKMHAPRNNVPYTSLNNHDMVGDLNSELLPNSGSHNGHCHGAIGRETGGRLVILLLAVSAHSFFEGLALGLQTDKVKALNLFIAIILHEALVSAAIGMNIAQRKSGSLRSALPYVVLLSVTIPVGVFVGYFVRAAPGTFGEVTSGVLQGFAAGVFIYISFVEMMPMELAPQDHNLIKITFIFVGFLIVTVLNLTLDMKS